MPSTRWGEGHSGGEPGAGAIPCRGDHTRDLSPESEMFRPSGQGGLLRQGAQAVF